MSPSGQELFFIFLITREQCQCTPPSFNVWSKLDQWNLEIFPTYISGDFLSSFLFLVWNVTFPILASLSCQSVSCLNTRTQCIIPPSGITISPLAFKGGHSQIPSPTCVPLWVCGDPVLIMCVLIPEYTTNPFRNFGENDWNWLVCGVVQGCSRLGKRHHI